MNKLNALHAHLVSLNLVDKNQIDSWVEDAKLVPEGSVVTVGNDDMRGINLAYVQYRAVFLIENYHGDAKLLFALVMAWLMQNDTDRSSNDDPTFEIDMLDDKHADVELHIPFEEKIQLMPQANGRVDFYGERWGIADPDIETAEEIVMIPRPESAS